MTVPECETEHSVHQLHALDAEFFVEMNDDLGVALRAKPMPSRLKAGFQLEVVVDLAVVHQRECPVVAHHRLPGSRRKIDDTEAPMSEPEPAVVRQINALVIWPPMGQCIPHSC